MRFGDNSTDKKGSLARHSTGSGGLDTTHVQRQMVYQLVFLLLFWNQVLASSEMEWEFYTGLTLIGPFYHIWKLRLCPNGKLQNAEMPNGQHILTLDCN